MCGITPGHSCMSSHTAIHFSSFSPRTTPNLTSPLHGFSQTSLFENQRFSPSCSPPYPSPSPLPRPHGTPKQRSPERPILPTVTRQTDHSRRRRRRNNLAYYPVTARRITAALAVLAQAAVSAVKASSAMGERGGREGEREG